MGTVRGTPFLPKSPKTQTAALAGLDRPAARHGAGEHQIVVVGAPAAAARTASIFLVGLPSAFALPLVVLLGGADGNDRERLVRLQAHSALPVRLIDDKDPILAGRVHLAPADYHLLVEGDHFALSVEGPVSGARPSIDVLFESVADTFGPRAVCVLLGHEDGSDGRAGAAKVRARGGLVIVENPATAAVGEGTKADLDGTEAHLAAATMLHLSEIAPFVSNLGELEVT
jgi:two-component system, chemotaxis family, protein-glutamate methylesterase/glutaminase